MKKNLKTIYFCANIVENINVAKIPHVILKVRNVSLNAKIITFIGRKQYSIIVKW
jgi:hypothetical protein